MKRALRLGSGTVRALAREAGVSEGLIRHIRDGRQAATARTVEALAEALERIADRNAQAARVLRESLTTDKEARP